MAVNPPLTEEALRKEHAAARTRMEHASLQEDLRAIDLLFGRQMLPYGSTPAQVKAFALEQLELQQMFDSIVLLPDMLDPP
jgi:hypothetical protein